MSIYNEITADEYEDSIHCPRQERIDCLQAIVDTYAHFGKPLDLQQLVYVADTQTKIEGLQRSLATSQGITYEEYLDYRRHINGL